MRSVPSSGALLAAAAWLAFALPAAAQTGDVWPDLALDDEEAAALGREALPFTQEQIELLGLLLRQTRAATARGAGEPPEPRQRRLSIDPAALDAPPLLQLARGWASAVSFVDSTGEPWPIEEVHVDRQFVPAGSGERAEGGRHLLYLAPSRANSEGNALVKLAGLVEPVALHLAVAPSGPADVRVDIRIARPGPNADAAALVQRPAWKAGDPVLLDLLAGVAPDGASRRPVEGGHGDDRAWSTAGGDLLLLTRALVLAPGAWAAERDGAGRWAWRLPATPYALVSHDGRELRLAFGEGEP